MHVDLGATGTGDMVLGMNEINTGYDITANCPLARLTFRPGELAQSCSILHYWSMHTGGALFLYADGHVAFKSYNGGAVLQKEARRNDRQGNIQ